jgi:hypothetical protein
MRRRRLVVIEPCRHVERDVRGDFNAKGPAPCSIDQPGRVDGAAQELPGAVQVNLHPFCDPA